MDKELGQEDFGFFGFTNALEEPARLLFVDDEAMVWVLLNQSGQSVRLVIFTLGLQTFSVLEGDRQGALHFAQAHRVNLRVNP